MIDLSVNGVRVTLMPTSSSRAERSPDPRESAIFVDLAEQVFDRFRPDLLLTFGGHPASLELMRRARQRRVAVVFHLHNSVGRASPSPFGPISCERGFPRASSRPVLPWTGQDSSCRETVDPANPARGGSGDRAPKATGRIKFTCDTVLCGLRYVDRVYRYVDRVYRYGQSGR